MALLLPLRNLLLRPHVAIAATRYQHSTLWRQKLRFFTSSRPRIAPASRPLQPSSSATTPSPARPKVQDEQQTTKQGKIKGFMKKYGTVGVGVYLALSAVDLSLTMAVISVKGADRVRNMEDWILYKVKGWIGMEHKPEKTTEQQQHGKPSFTSLFVIAYGIHKTIFLPVRLSLTAAITPAVARRLRDLGWIKSRIK